MRDHYDITFSAGLSGDFAIYSGQTYTVHHSYTFEWGCGWSADLGGGKSISLDWASLAPGYWGVVLNLGADCWLVFQWGDETNPCDPKVGTYGVNLGYSSCTGCSDTNSCTDSAGATLSIT